MLTSLSVSSLPFVELRIGTLRYSERSKQPRMYPEARRAAKYVPLPRCCTVSHQTRVGSAEWGLWMSTWHWRRWAQASVMRVSGRHIPGGRAKAHGGEMAQKCLSGCEYTAWSLGAAAAPTCGSLPPGERSARGGRSGGGASATGARRIVLRFEFSPAFSDHRKGARGGGGSHVARHLIN